MAELPLVVLDDVAVDIADRTLLRDVTLGVDAGQSVAVMGPSGVGKSTLLNVILGITTPSSGQAVVNGRDWSGMRRGQRSVHRAASVGVVFQDPLLIDELDALENVVLPALWSNRREGVTERATALLEACRLRTGATPARDLSGGERQRVAIARSLINSPAVLLADEPTGSLDSSTSTEVADLLFEQPRRSGCALVVVTHDAAISERADRVLMLSESGLSAAS